MKFRDFFDRIRIISLPTRLDRRRQVVNELRRHEIAMEPGKVEFFDGIRMTTDAGFSSVGVHGCYLSHLGVIREARDAGLANVLVLEDDFQFSRKFVSHQEMLIEQLQNQPWDIAFFGHQVEPDAGVDPAAPPRLTPIDYRRHMMLLHCYAINSTIFDRLIAFLEAILTRPAGHPDCGPMDADGAISEFRSRNPDVVTLVVQPNLCWQRSSRTDNRGLRWFDRTPIVRSMVGRARRVKSWVGSFR